MRQKNQQYTIIKPTEKEMIFFEHWTCKRAMPKWKYILMNGILKEGLIFFLVVKFLQFLILSSAFRIFYSSLNGVLFLFFEIIFWVLGGIVVGWFKYSSNEIEYELIKGITE